MTRVESHVHNIATIFRDRDNNIKVKGTSGILSFDITEVVTK